VRFIEEMFESISPEQTRGRQVTVREMLDVAAARVPGSFRDRPMSEAAIRETFGRAYAGIGQLERGKQQIEHALKLAAAPQTPDEHGLNIQLRELLGSVEMEMGNFPEAEQTLREVLADAKRQLGESHILTLSVKERLAATLHDRNKLDEALALRKELDSQVANLPPEMIRVVLAQKGNYGVLLQAMDRPAEAEKMYREAIETGTRVLGGDHPDVIGAKLALGTLLRDRGDFAGAMASLDEVYKEAQRVFGPDHPNTLVAAHTAGLVMSAAGRSKDAEVLLADCVDRCKRVLGEDHPTTLYTAHDLAQIWMVTRRFELAEPVMANIIPRMQRTFGEDHRDTLMYRGDYARIIASRGDLAGAEEIYRDISQRLARTLGADHEYALTTRGRLGAMLVQQKKFGEAEPILAASYAAEKQRTGRRIAWATQASYGLCLQQLGKYDEAIPVLLEAEALIRAYPRLDRASMKNVAFALAHCYEATGKPEDALRYRSIEREVMTTQPATQPAPVLN
jgi:tetratricopeptide (TPR) repeat protein